MTNNISVIMGVHNGSKTLARAVDSLCNQDLLPLEILICDDCSTDSTSEVVKELQGKYSVNIIYLKNEENSGLAYSLNKCLENSHGNYIARMDDDDVSHPDRFRKQVEFLNTHPEYDIVGGRANYFDSKGIWKQSTIKGEVTPKDIMMYRSFIHPTVMMRRSALEKVGGYTVSPLTIRSQDFDLWCKLYYSGSKGYVIDEELLDYYDPRDVVKEVNYKYKKNLFVMTKNWRRKMKLPIWYDYYAYRTISKTFIPKWKLEAYKKRGQNEKD